MKRKLIPGILTMLTCLTVGLPLSAQEDRNNNRTSEEMSQSTLSLPGGEQLLELRAETPQQVWVGESYDMKIHVTNTSDSVELHDVRLQPNTLKSFEIESVELQQNQQSKGKKQQSNNENQKKNKQNASSDNQQEAKIKENRWVIPSLSPGETKTFLVSATSDQEGKKGLCLFVKSYTPALCLETEVVQPELELVKQAPKEQHLCKIIEYSYFVKNGGDAETGTFTIKDQLADGILTESGKDQLTFEVDNLAPDEVRKFVARVRATKTGEFSSRAVAELGGDQTVKSKKSSTNVINADLAIALEGPDSEYINTPLKYTVRVTNHGDAVAPDTMLTVNFPEEASLEHTGEVRKSDKKVQQNQSDENEPTKAKKQSKKDQKESGNNNQNSNRLNNSQQDSMTEETWELGSLQPGQSKLINFTLRSDQQETLRCEAVASFVCGQENSTEEEIEVTSISMLETEIIAIPALMLTLVDSEDPVVDSDEVTYTIVVKNQGDAADQNVQIEAELPESLTYVDSSGPSKATSTEGSNIAFKPVKTLAAGDKLTWRVTTRSEGQGDGRFLVKLTSKSLTKPASAEEPTQFVSQKTKKSNDQDDENN
ncbi:Hypothetical protein PBC10988_17110 [Planctomycetales bacterium 10988]|nr:Hypothetical protein PBC10988_17110 [Planctomycetales bacterium 10988]